ncbi:biotin transporter BioY [Corynebacterium epidermidicanis]|uniref:Biotin transporter n=1 Tax=Corynebacterium epidermidicanis TaxID=1050174 RepID=A0A0G3GQ62_9CORY|nr:biotin transporter BioY [Corynebacterium epidermidicanis]AKK03351.1 hypothetical protein CEPID_07500 [Corynebacterium epidermidicanis]
MAASSANQVRDIAYVAVFAALIIVFAFVSLPTASGVPIVLQNAVIILAGLVLGGRRGFLAVLLFLILGLIGLPVLAGGRNVLTALAGPAAGYLIGYPISAAVAGSFAAKAPRAKVGQIVTLSVGAILALFVQYGCGVCGLILRAHMDAKAAIVAQSPFIIPDLIKVIVMVIIAVALINALPGLRTSRSTSAH